MKLRSRLQNKKSNQWSVILFVLVFASIGAAIILLAHALTGTIAVEPETGTKSGPVSVINDNSASGGKYVQFNSITSGPVYYLATNGSDSNSGTITQPWKTFTASLPKLKPGDTLYVRAGTYTENVAVTDVPDGTSTSRIMLSNYPGESPVIENQVLLGSPSYWTISGLKVHWTSTSAVPGGLLVRIYGGTGWILENSEIWGSRGTAELHIDDGPQNSIGTWTVRDSCFHDTISTDGTNQDHLLYINNTNGGTGVIEGNILYNSTNGRGIKLGPGTSSGGPTNVTVRYNTFYNNLGPSNIQLSIEASNNTIYRNLMQLTNPSHTNITVDDTFSGQNNLAHDNAGWDSAGVVQSNPGLTNGGGNVSINPQFDSLTCSSFHPTNSQAQSYGKYALP